jgi:hypothetical protein
MRIEEKYDHSSSWVLEAGKTYTYSMIIKSGLIGKQLFETLQESTQYISVASKDAVESTAGSYYYDTSAGKLYIHCTDNVNPNNHLITAKFRN